MCLNKFICEKDVFYCLGGDEFVLVMLGINDIYIIICMVKLFLVVIVILFNMVGYELVIILSVGIVLFFEDGNILELLFKNVDIVMYYVKKKGNSYLFFNDIMNC